MRPPLRNGLLAAVALLVVAVGGAIVLISVNAGGGGPIVDVPGGDPDRGRELVGSYGCGSCHTIPGIDSTDKYIGPPLADFAERRYIAGDEPNRPDVLIRWIEHPQRVEPGTVMPDLGVSRAEARDIAAFLYSDP